MIDRPYTVTRKTRIFFLVTNVFAFCERKNVRYERFLIRGGPMFPSKPLFKLVVGLQRIVAFRGCSQATADISTAQAHFKRIVAQVGIQKASVETVARAGGVVHSHRDGRCDGRNAASAPDRTGAAAFDNRHWRQRRQVLQRRLGRGIASVSERAWQSMYTSAPTRRAASTSAACSSPCMRLGISTARGRAAAMIS